MEIKSVHDVLAIDPILWMQKAKIRVDGHRFELQGRTYQQEIMRPTLPDGRFKHNEVIRKGSQIGITMGKVGEATHGALYKHYPQGIIFYFPSQKAVEIFSKSRFKPFIDDNYEVRSRMGKTDSISIRRVGDVNVYFFGGSATSRVGGEKKDSTAVRSTPADWVILDERDLFDDEMAKQVNQRLGNSVFRRRTDIGTPTIPEFGVDLLYRKCLAPDTRILTADLRWVRADTLAIGDKLVGFDEEKLPGNKTRQYHTTRVTELAMLSRRCSRLTLDDGTEVVSSWSHRWLSEKSTMVKWRETGDLEVGDSLMSIGDRLMENVDLIWENVTVGSDHGNTKKPKIVKIEDLGYRQVIAITTEHKTLVANGLLSHNSDQRRWQILCDCGKYTCMETEFPSCFKMGNSVVPACVHCGREIHPALGLWVPDFPDRDVVGYWPSQLLNPNSNYDLILKQFEDPEAYDLNKGELMRTVMGLPHVEEDDALSESEVFNCCGSASMAWADKGPCAMGVDVGNPIYCVIGHRVDKRYSVLRVCSVPDWQSLHDLIVKYNVKSTVIDAQPEYHKVREFQAAHSNVHLCYYSEHQKVFDSWDQKDNIVKVNRTEVMDASAAMIRSGLTVLPAKCEEMKKFAYQMTRSVRVLEDDGRTGAKIYRYRVRGDKEDHYRHAMNYYYLACKRVGSPAVFRERKSRPVMQDMDYKIGVS